MGKQCRGRLQTWAPRQGQMAYRAGLYKLRQWKHRGRFTNVFLLAGNYQGFLIHTQTSLSAAAACSPNFTKGLPLGECRGVGKLFGHVRSTAVRTVAQHADRDALVVIL